MSLNNINQFLLCYHHKNLLTWSSYGWLASCALCHCSKPKAFRPQRRRGHVTAILFCIPSKIQIRQWFVSNYSTTAVWTALCLLKI